MSDIEKNPICAIKHAQFIQNLLHIRGITPHSSGSGTGGEHHKVPCTSRKLSSQKVPLLCRALNPPLPLSAHLINTFSLWINDSSETYSTQNNYKQLFHFFCERKMRRNCAARIAESKKFFIHVLIHEKVVMDWNLIPITPSIHGSLTWNPLIRENICFEPQNFKQRTIWITVAVSLISISNILFSTLNN